MSEDKKTLSIVEKMRLKAKKQEHYGGKMDDKSAEVSIEDCPNCGAGRAKQDGVTQCAYCGFEFLSVKLTDGLYVKKEDNSRS